MLRVMGVPSKVRETFELEMCEEAEDAGPLPDWVQSLMLPL